MKKPQWPSTNATPAHHKTGLLIAKYVSPSSEGKEDCWTKGILFGTVD